MDRLRQAILDLLNEDMGMVGEACETTIAVIQAFNDLDGVEPIVYEDD